MQFRASGLAASPVTACATSAPRSKVSGKPSAVGGREGAIIGGGLGGALGAAIGSRASDTHYRQPRPVVIEEPRYHHDNGLHLGHYKYKSKHGRGDD